MKKSLLIICLLVLGVTLVSEAQVYRTAAGVRLDGEQFGLTAQQRVHEMGTVQAIVALGTREYSGTALYQRHFPILGRRFNYYLGAGGHVGHLKDSGPFTGIDVIGGVEYKINGLPFLVSADIKPAVHFGHEEWTNLSTGISIRYVILPEKKKKKSLWPFGKKEEETKKKKKRGKQVEEEENDFLKIFRKRDN